MNLFLSLDGFVNFVSDLIMIKVGSTKEVLLQSIECILFILFYTVTATKKMILLCMCSQLSKTDTSWTGTVSVLERCPSYRESTIRGKKRQRPTLGIHFSEVPVL